MGKPAKFDMGAFAQRLAPEEPAAPAAVRDIETITGEILELKQDAGEAIIGIGKRLIEAKEMLPHGEWTPWLEERVEFSERSARNFMKLAREWTNRQTLAVLGASKAFVNFMAEARELTAAVENAGICLSKTRDQRARALFLMRGFYLLSVFRGGEAARAVLLDEEAEGGRFVLSRACALLFLKELSGLSSFQMEANCKTIGL